MADVYTPDPASAPASITLPEDGDLDTAAVLRAALAAVADMAFGGGAGGPTFSTFVDMALYEEAAENTLTFAGTVARVTGFGHYYFTINAGLAANEPHVVASLVIANGKWVKIDRSFYTSKLLPTIGALTGVSYTGPAPAGKIPTEFISYSHYSTTFINGGTDTSTDSTPITPTAGDVINVGGAAGILTIGTQAIGDIVECRLPMIGFNLGSDFSVGAFISFNDGATWTCVSPNVGGGPITYEVTPAGVGRAVTVDFVKEVTAAGVCKVQFKFGRASSGTTNVWWGPGRIRVERP